MRPEILNVSKSLQAAIDALQGQSVSQEERVHLVDRMNTLNQLIYTLETKTKMKERLADIEQNNTAKR